MIYLAFGIAWIVLMIFLVAWIAWATKEDDYSEDYRDSGP